MRCGKALNLARRARDAVRRVYRSRPPVERRVDWQIGRGDKPGFVDALSVCSYRDDRAERRRGGNLEPVGDRTCRTGPRRIGHSQHRPPARPRAGQWGERHRRIDGDRRANGEPVRGAEDARRAAAGGACVPVVAGRRGERIEPHGGLTVGPFGHGVLGLNFRRKRRIGRHLEGVGDARFGADRVSNDQRHGLIGVPDLYVVGRRQRARRGDRCGERFGAVRRRRRRRLRGIAALAAGGRPDRERERKRQPDKSITHSEPPARRQGTTTEDSCPCAPW